MENKTWYHSNHDDNRKGRKRQRDIWEKRYNISNHESLVT